MSRSDRQNDNRLYDPADLAGRTGDQLHVERPAIEAAEQKRRQRYSECMKSPQEGHRDAVKSVSGGEGVEESAMDAKDLDGTRHTGQHSGKNHRRYERAADRNAVSARRLRSGPDGSDLESKRGAAEEECDRTRGE
jgi:hypothetical protein